MSKIYVIAGLFLLGTILNAQEFTTTTYEYLIKVRPVDSKFWKYANLKGEIVIDCEYPKTYPFSVEGYAVAYFPKGNRFVIIDKKGNELNTEIKDFMLKDYGGYAAKGFSDGFVAVMIEKKWGYLDTHGKLAIPLKYDNVTEFNSGYGIARLNDRFYIIDKNGNETLIEDLGTLDVKRFSESLAPFKSANELWGYIDVKGKTAINPLYKAVGYFINGIAWARDDRGLVGLINTKGEWILPPEYNEIKPFDPESGLACVKKGENVGYINLSGEMTTFPITEVVDDFHEGLARGRKGLFFGFYDITGKWVIEPRYESVLDFKNGYAGAKSGGLWGLIDKKGNYIIQPVFLGIDDVMIVY